MPTNCLLTSVTPWLLPWYTGIESHKTDSWRLELTSSFSCLLSAEEKCSLSCYHRKRVLTKKTLDIRNSVPSSLFTQKKLVLTKKGHLIFVISNVFVLLVNHLLVLLTFGTRVFFLRKKNGPPETGGHKTDFWRLELVSSFSCLLSADEKCSLPLLPL